MTAPSHRPIDFAYWLPWTRIFRCFRVATDPRKLTLAAAGLLLLWAGDRALSAFGAGGAAPPPWEAARPALLVGWGAADSVWNGAEAVGDEAARLADRLLLPVRPIAGVVGLTFAGSRGWPAVAAAWLRFAWALAVWSLVGGAIARIAAVELARDERVSLLSAVRFAGGRFLSFFAAPMLPLVGVLVLWGLLSLGGLAGRIPVAGPWLVAAAWGLAAAVALLVVVVAVAAAAGWPLMTAAIAAEGSDAFDGFSRSFSYLYGRSWSFVWYALLALAFGVLSVAVIDTAAVGAAVAAARTVATGMGAEPVAELHAAAPGYFRSTGTYPFVPAESAGGPATLTAVWLAALALAAVGFAASFFWTAATAVYFLLRRADDATHFDEVYLGETAEEEDDLLPLAGIAATGQPVVERSHHPTVEPVVSGERDART